MNISDLIQEAKKHHPQISEEKLRAAFEFADMAHAGQTRMSGEPYIVHPLGVAMILAEYGADEASLVAALLHDVVEDTQYGLPEIEKRFGKGIAKMVDTLTKLPHTLPGDARSNQLDTRRVESIRKIFDVMQDDVRLIVIKLCDRLHNMSTLVHFRPDKQKRISQETLEIFVRIAGRLSAYDLKEKLEELGFRYLYPDLYQQLQQKLTERQPQFLKNKRRVLERLATSPLLKSSKETFFQQIIPYVRYHESKTKESLEIQQVITLIFDREEDCYLAAMEVHKLWKNIRGTFLDFISLPKSNGYQALETCVQKSDGTQYRFVFQTRAMYDYARLGVIQACFSDSDESRKIRLPWLENLKRIHRETKSEGQDYIATLENDLLKGAIIVYTGENKTLFLPPESTVLDAAFFCFGERAQYLAGVTINEVERGLSTYLKDRDSIRFVLCTQKNLKADWLDLVNTAFSKSIIYDINQKLTRAEKIRFGTSALQKQFQQLGMGFIDEIDASTISRIFKGFHVSGLSDLAILVSEGRMSPQVASRQFSKLNEKAQDSVRNFELEVELHPDHPEGPSILINTLIKKKIDVSQLNLQKLGRGIVVKSYLNFPLSHYNDILRAIRGLPDIRSVCLSNIRQRNIGRGLLFLLMILVAADPVIAFYLLNEHQIIPRDLVTIRFLTMFLLSSFLLLFQKWANGIEEVPINHRRRGFVLSAVTLFLTAVFSYLLLSRGASPLLYQFSIYTFLFALLFFSTKQISLIRKILYGFFNFGLFVAYFFFLSPEHSGSQFALFAALVLVALSFVLYSKFSLDFQEREHIQRRHLSFFRSLSLAGFALSIPVYFFSQQVVLPSPEAALIAVLYSTLFIFVPYILHFMISGSHAYKSGVMRTLIFTLALVYFFQFLIHQTTFHVADLMVIVLFIGGYFIFTSKAS